jgi:hypothetical protein
VDLRRRARGHPGARRSHAGAAGQRPRRSRAGDELCAALFNLLVATRHAGGEPAVELLPDAADRDLLATVLLHGRGDPRAEADRLHAAIELRRTHRGTFVDRALPAGLHDELRACARAEGAWLELLDDDARDRLADLIAEGDRMQWANRHWRRELAAWLHPRRKGDGLVMPELFAPLAHAAVMTLDIGMPAAARNRDRARQAPAIVVLDTHGDRPRDWLAAGMALEHVVLHAASRGLQGCYLNQPIQVPELRMHVASLLGRPCFPQAIIELGHPAQPTKPTPRRPLAEVMDAAGA